MDPTITLLEELTLSTSPAIHHGFHDGWVLRASGTDTRRANSCTPLHASTLALEGKITYVEGWYKRHGQPAMFRLNDASEPQLDAALANRGYVREVETRVLVLDLDTDLVEIPPLPPGAKIVERDDADGLDDWHHLKRSADGLAEQDRVRQALWRGPQLNASLKTLHGLASTGMVRIESDHAGIFCMRTAEKARRKGHASRVLGYLLTWAQAQGARRAFLQVDAANVEAIALYARFGFVPQYTYWHRVALPRP
ncbi:MAG TPA: GNAT family N-acetyltransferase [Usitatibacteraceae bacterium]|nr:GNAT family N-acetyltransferase [Usitatibacteraceae bacterium]